MQLPLKDRYTEGRRKLIGMLTGLMGGRAAEELIFGDVTTGAHSDIRQASHLARMMVCEWGMSQALGPQSFGEREELLFLGREVSRSQEFSEETARKIDEEVSRLIRECHERALDILRKNRKNLDTVANLLLERETLDGRDVEEIVKHGRILSEVERKEADARSEGKQAMASDLPVPESSGPASA
jgi:cell division protease FtsH